MNDQDYFKDGVELADGWGIDGIWLCVGDAGAKIHDAEFDLSRPLPNYIKDALAAQLYRQCVEAGEPVAWLCDGINTIKEIIDSKVLLGS